MHGWFKATCVEEIAATAMPTSTQHQPQPQRQLPPKQVSIHGDGDDDESVIVNKRTLLGLIAQSELHAPRTVVLQRGKKGFGFVLRGAKGKRATTKEQLMMIKFVLLCRLQSEHELAAAEQNET